MRKHILLTTALAAALLMQVSDSQAQRQHRRHAMGGQGLERIATELGLSAEQKAKFQDMHYAHQKEAIELRAKTQLATLELGKLTQPEKPDMAQVKKQTELLGALKAQMQFAGIKHRKAVENVLTAEQREKFKSMGHLRSHGGRGKAGMHRPDFDGPRGTGDAPRMRQNRRGAQPAPENDEN